MNVQEIDAASRRQDVSNPAVAPMFLSRWSPRAMSGDTIAQADLESLIEAARWAPSCFNAQPWRFVVASRGTPGFENVLATLAEANQAWAGEAGALIGIISRTRYEHNDQAAHTHSFDAGAAWMSLALQAHYMGLVAHGMAGFDQAAARDALRVPEIYDLPAIIAVGYPGSVSGLPEAYQAKESPSQRKALGEIFYTATFEGLE